MALVVPNVLETLVAELSFPRRYDRDATRDAAALDLRALDYSVHVGGRPQGSKDMGITLELQGGQPWALIDAAASSSMILIDVTFWSHDAAGNRANATTIWQLMQLCNIILVGLKRPASASQAQIFNIVKEAEPFQADVPPIDKSDGWQARFTTVYMVYWRALAARRLTV